MDRKTHTNRTFAVKPATFYFFLFCTCFSLFIAVSSLSRTPESASAASGLEKKDGIIKNQGDYDILKAFTDVIALIKKNYYREVDFPQLVQGAIKGMVTTLDPHSSYLTPENFKLYRKQIVYETGAVVRRKDSLIYINDTLTHDYTFRSNWYFIAGDKVMNSQDSRYIGLIPETFIIGKASRVLTSKDRNTGKRRWNRMFKRIQ